MEGMIAFKSRRNCVWREGGTVYKRIMGIPGEPEKPCHRAAFEADMINRLYRCGVRVPRLISCKDDWLAMDYVESRTLVEYIDSCEIGAERVPHETIIDNVSVWFESFYDAVQNGIIRGDVNCRNFLLTPNGSVFGVDFEGPFIGKREDDLGRILAYILTYKPQYTPFKTRFADMLCRAFNKRFNLELNLVAIATDKEIGDMAVRRDR